MEAVVRIRGILERKIVLPVMCLLLLNLVLMPQPAFAPRGGVHHGGGGHHGGYHGGHHGGHPHHHMHVHMWHPHLWHPIGFFITAMAVTAIVVSVNNRNYHYDNGVYYEESTSDSGQKGYVAVPAPIGAKVPSLPEGYETVTAGSHQYYYYGGVFYTKDTDGKYVVVQGPVGAVVANLPDGAKEETYNDVQYYNYGGIYFQPKSVNGDTQYQVVQHP